MSFAKRLQTLRKDENLSQEDLAEKIGISRQAISKWEAGNSYPDVDKLIGLSQLFGVSIDSLVKEKEACSLSEAPQKVPYISEKIIDFLCRAKKETYAGKGKEALPSRPASHDLQYTEGDLKYIDTYIGGEHFAGEEALWQNDSPFWAMNYMGRIIGEGFSGEFLKEVLLRVPKEQPYRGPMVYQNGDYKYHAIVEGEFNWFQGREEIFFKENKIYECRFHGGIIK